MYWKRFTPSYRYRRPFTKIHIVRATCVHSHRQISISGRNPRIGHVGFTSGGVVVSFFATATWWIASAEDAHSIWMEPSEPDELRTALFISINNWVSKKTSAWTLYITAVWWRDRPQGEGHGSDASPLLWFIFTKPWSHRERWEQKTQSFKIAQIRFAGAGF